MSWLNGNIPQNIEINYARPSTEHTFQQIGEHGIGVRIGAGIFKVGLGKPITTVRSLALGAAIQRLKVSYMASVDGSINPVLRSSNNSKKPGNASNSARQVRCFIQLGQFINIPVLCHPLSPSGLPLSCINREANAGNQHDPWRVMGA